jgi:hypothetical protein
VRRWEGRKEKAEAGSGKSECGSRKKRKMESFEVGMVKV